MSRLAVFARYPAPGGAKTRLYPALPPELSAALHLAMVSDALDLTVAVAPGQAALYWTGDQAPDIAVPPGIQARRQAGNDLGQRLAAAFGELLGGPGDRAIVIGSDCPDLGPDVVRWAFSALDRHDLVLGPARDGGYYLIGLRRPSPALFAGVSWGTDRVLAQTLERARVARLAVATLAVLRDIDTAEDLVQFIGERTTSSPGPGAHTESALREMGLLPPRG